MAVKMLNVEVGKRLTKVCITEKKGKTYSVSDSFVFATPEGSVVDGQIVSEINLGDKLNEELDERAIAAKDVYFSVASSKIAVREVVTPAVKDEQLKGIVQTNAADYFPVDITKYKIDCVLLERGAEECRVLVVAVPTLIVESYMALADYAGLSIKGIDYSANSQFQVLKTISGGEKVDMFITIDADSSSVNFSENGNLLMQRSLSIGGDEMICRYLAAKEMDDSAYIFALNELSGKGENPAEDIDLSDSIYRLTGGISRSLDYFNSANPEKEIGRVVLMGSCAHLKGLKDAIASELGVETLCLDELSDIQGLANSISDISVYIGCLGTRMAPLDLLPAEYVKAHGGGNKKLLNDKNFGYIGGGALLLIALLLTAYSLGGYFINKSKLEKINDEVSKLEYAEQEFKAYLSYSSGDADLQKFVDGSVANNSNLLKFFEELEAKMPTSVSFLTANCTEENVTISLTCPSFKEAAEVLRELRSFATIDVITCSPITETADDAGKQLAQFSVVCDYIVEEETTVPTTAAETTTEAE